MRRRMAKQAGENRVVGRGRDLFEDEVKRLYRAPRALRRRHRSDDAAHQDVLATQSAPLASRWQQHAEGVFASAVLSVCGLRDSSECTRGGVASGGAH
jgi:hypothetical protein